LEHQLLPDLDQDQDPDQCSDLDQDPDPDQDLDPDPDLDQDLDPDLDPDPDLILFFWDIIVIILL
jgi:hypothetical protein